MRPGKKKIDPELKKRKIAITIDPGLDDLLNELVEECRLQFNLPYISKSQVINLLLNKAIDIGLDTEFLTTDFKK